MQVMDKKIKYSIAVVSTCIKLDIIFIQKIAITKLVYLSNKQIIFQKSAPKKITPLPDHKQFFPSLLRYASEISATWQKKSSKVHHIPFLPEEKLR
jgi:hypothetical protein